MAESKVDNLAVAWVLRSAEQKAARWVVWKAALSVGLMAGPKAACSAVS